MSRIDFSEKAWDDYLYWQIQDKKLMKKINELLKSVERDGENDGLGKPEALKDNLSGYYSRRIDDKNRLVYRVNNGVIEIASCKGHYD